MSTAAPSAAPSARRGRTRERLLDAAYEAFADVGLAAVSVEQICERAGFTRGAFYSNFETKEELFFALLDREKELRLRQLEEGIDALLPTDGSGADLDDEHIGAVVVELIAGPLDTRQWCVMHLELELLALRDPAVATRFTADRERLLASVLPLVDRALTRAGRAFRVDPEVALRLLITTHGELQRAAVMAGEDVGGPALQRGMADVALALTRRVPA